MKRAIYLLSVITLAHSALAETRNLTSEWQIAKEGQKTAWLLDWPAKPGDKFTLRYPDGKPYLQATLQDNNHEDLLASENMTGKYRFYYPDGKIKKEGEWDKEGTSVGLETTYYENGSPKEVNRYLDGGWSINERAYYKNGQLSYEGLNYDGEKYKESKYYYNDGKLKQKNYTKTIKNIEKEMDDYFDENGKLIKRIEEYGNDPSIQITYGADGKIVERRTLMTGMHRSKTETFNSDGQLTDLVQYITNGSLLNDGEQISSYEGKTTYSTYKNGVQEGEEKTVKDGKVVRYSQFKAGKETGDSFAFNDVSNVIIFEKHASDKQKAVSYYVGLDYITYDDKGMPHVKLPFNLDSRVLPKPGTVWEYSSDGKHSSALKLITSDDKTATWRTDHGEIKENLDTYTWIMPNQPQQDRQILSFPLTPGKEWKSSYQTRVTVPWGKGQEWGYTYKATSLSNIVGVEKITVAGGTFDTLLITRSIHWTKSSPHHAGTQASEMTCYTKACEVSGYTAETIWYAPEIGRAVMKAVKISGSPQDLMSNSDASMLKSGNVLISELTSFGPASVKDKPAPEIHYAHQISGNAFSQGFSLRPNNTWEFLMIHSPMIE